MFLNTKMINNKNKVVKATAYNGAVCRNGGCGSSDNKAGTSPLLPRSKRVETRHCGKPLGRCTQAGDSTTNRNKNDNIWK
jgi:hypothetical protein